MCSPDNKSDVVREHSPFVTSVLLVTNFGQCSEFTRIYIYFTKNELRVLCRIAQFRSSSSHFSGTPKCPIQWNGDNESTINQSHSGENKSIEGNMQVRVSVLMILHEYLLFLSDSWFLFGH